VTDFARTMRIDIDFFGTCPKCEEDVYLSEAEVRTCLASDEITLKCSTHDGFEVQAGKLSKANPNRNPGKLTGKYVRLNVAPSTGMGTIGHPIIDCGHERYLFRPDPRIVVSGPPTRPFYVSEDEFESCDRPSDAVVEGINKFARCGQN
jgi:hypothetical protein